MTETRSNSQNSEKIATMSKVLDYHEQTLQEIHKQLQTINSFMQRIAEMRRSVSIPPLIGHELFKLEMLTI